MLVKQAISAQYPLGAGAPIMVVGGGGNRGRGVRGRTKREIAGGVLGGLVGVAGALTGQHRSLGGLTQSMISSGAQGRALGQAAGRLSVGRRRQAMADIKEAERAENARLAAEHQRITGADPIGILPSTRDRGLANQRRAFIRREQQKAADEKQRVRQEQMARAAYARAFGSKMGEEDRVDAETMRNLRRRFGNIDPFEASSRVKTMNEAFDNRPTPEPADFEQMDGSYPVAVVDPVQARANAAAANPTQAAAEFNAVPQPVDGALAETTKDGNLESAANYGADAINDEGDYGQLTDNEKSLQRTLEQSRQQPDEERGGGPVRVRDPVDPAQSNLKQFS